MSVKKDGGCDGEGRQMRRRRDVDEEHCRAFCRMTEETSKRGTRDLYNNERDMAVVVLPEWTNDLYCSRLYAPLKRSKNAKEQNTTDLSMQPDATQSAQNKNLGV